MLDDARKERGIMGCVDKIIHFKQATNHPGHGLVHCGEYFMEAPLIRHVGIDF